MWQYLHYQATRAVSIFRLAVGRYRHNPAPCGASKPAETGAAVSGTGHRSLRPLLEDGATVGDANLGDGVPGMTLPARNRAGDRRAHFTAFQALAAYGQILRSSRRRISVVS